MIGRREKRIYKCGAERVFCKPAPRTLRGDKESLQSWLRRLCGRMSGCCCFSEEWLYSIRTYLGQIQKELPQSLALALRLSQN